MVKMNDHDADITCPFCNKHHDMAANVTGKRGPRDGDISICIRCREFSVFQGGKLRKPDKVEAEEIAANKDMQRLKTLMDLNPIEKWEKKEKYKWEKPT